jgi:hypothetical protein
MRRLLGRTLAIVTVAVSVMVGWAACALWTTDQAYDRLISSDAQSRSAVRRALGDFQETHITRTNEASPLLKEFVKPGFHYVRYTNWSGLPIDVVYDTQNRVVRIWPEYE